MTTTNERTTGLNLQAFDFEEAPVRVLMAGQIPWFVATDVARVLNIQNIRQNLNRLDADEKDTVCLTYGNRGNPNTTIINESGLYTLILRCDDAIKPGTTAHRFRKWVTGEVLPALRKEGAYSLAKAAEQDEHAARLRRVRGEVVNGIRTVSDVIAMTMDMGVMRGRMPMSRVRVMHTLGRLRLDALRELWVMESGGTPARLSHDGTQAIPTTTTADSED